MTDNGTDAQLIRDALLRSLPASDAASDGPECAQLLSSVRQKLVNEFPDNSRAAVSLHDRAPVRRVAAADSNHRSTTEPLPVLQHFPAALDIAEANARVAPVAQVIRKISSRIDWYRRPGSTDQYFADRHSLAILLGDGGIGQAAGLQVGLALTAPGTVYPEHQHPPEELYLVLSDGEWLNSRLPWHRPGTAGIVYNPPAIMHSMRALEQPLLALWFQII